MLGLAQVGAAEGLWLRAERQTGGRGRQGRVWESPAGNLYASTLVRLRPNDPEAATLALVAAVALQEAVGTYVAPAEAGAVGSGAIGSPGNAAAPASAGATVVIKWPNDLLLGGAKLSGILLERTGDAVVIGMGVNLAHHPERLDRPVTSLAAHGPAPAPAEFIETLAEGFARWLGLWRGQGLGPVRARWLERAHPSGTPLTARLPDGSAVDGLFDGLDAGGALVLRLADGGRRVIHAGDVFLI
ncbi:biotin--[acetyl-CoA-carboxylase] ligase [Sphingomonas immobilis]|uniref:biotin--[biotin carboxyl-carrier protein] ligase n=1 Tax=Sphingomonas immobilis TaxID=3063997 RepID=A0ABT8ZY03_9SPHN|nr:biotin--[acetyl-CoA-carboxylase] ligase [Sphingomonas sp. CA1-15]MDO7842439.1 biotin--[acetyl-CoA-carboxylase] ligase [Sphingomonas sp. CA1-15]